MMTARPPFLKMKRKYEVDESYWLVRESRSTSRRALLTLRRAALFFKWGRVPEIWELSFIDRMRKLQRAGVAFDEVLRSTLPEIFGEDTSLVLRTWVGRKARRNPERFTRSISEMFGASSRNVLGSVDSLVDEASLLQKKVPREPPIQCLLDAIQRADAAMTAAQPVSLTTALLPGQEGSVQPVRAARTDGKGVRRPA
jgi:hypothetical protein